MPYFLTLALLLALAQPARAADNAKLPAAELFSMAAALDKLPAGQRDAFSLRHRIWSKQAGKPLSVWYEDQGQKIEIPLRADGSFDRPAALARPGFNPMLMANQPEAGVELSIDLLAQVADSRELHYADLMRSVTQMNAFIKSQAGLMSLFAPTVHSLHFRCQPQAECALTAHLPEGPKTYVPDASGRITLKLSKALMKANPRLSGKTPFAEIVGDME